MAIIQITKIQFRRGLESELTSSRNNSSGLDQGEPGFTTDSGRLFLGSNATSGAWSARIVPPYDNIEVLTEFSTDTFARLFDRMHRTQGPVGILEVDDNRDPYLIATLTANTIVWTPVDVETFDVTTGLYVGVEPMIICVSDGTTNDPSSMSATIPYSLYSNTSVIRAGTLTVVHNGNTLSNIALLEDDYVRYSAVVGNGTPCPVTTAFPTGIQFQVIQGGPPALGNYTFVLEYQNAGIERHNNAFYGCGGETSNALRPTGGLMNPFLLSPQERLADWKQFRRNLTKLPEDEQLKKVAQYWAQAPLLTIAYDVEQPSSWLTPWEMIYEGDWCRYSVAIGMEFTLRLAGWDPKRLSLAMLRDFDLSDMFFVVIIDDSKLLNYTYSCVSAYPKTKHDVITRMRFSGRFYNVEDG